MLPLMRNKRQSSMRRRFLFSTCILLCSIATAEPDDGRQKGLDQFAAAYRGWDGKLFSAATQTLASEAAKSSATALDYFWLGVARFHLMLHTQHAPGAAPDASAVASLRDGAIDALKEAVKRDSRHAEAHALLGTLYGMKIEGSMLRALWFGPQVVEHRDLALALGAENPRVLYLLGTCQYHTAKNAVGYNEALASLLKSERYFADEALTPAVLSQPRWGYEACLVFIGRTYEALNSSAEVSRYYQKALERSPSDHVAKEGL
ncbi:MAG: hypothetical protein ACOYMN_14545, partial [Roseimicrobium sp.]